MTTDKVIMRHDLQSMMSVTSETVRRWIKQGRLPKPDVAISHRTMGWKVSTLQNSGINLPA